MSSGSFGGGNGDEPALTRKSARTDLILVCVRRRVSADSGPDVGAKRTCPLLKSSPPMKLLRVSASWMHPGTNVFWGAPLM